MHVRNQYLDYLIDSRFQPVNKIFALSYGKNGQRKSFKQYFPPTVEVKDCGIMINGRNFFD